MPVKLDELDQSWGFRTCDTSGAADAERMKSKLWSVGTRGWHDQP